MTGKNRFRSKVKVLFDSCRDEIEKTTNLGKKMLTASRTNSELHATYEELGQYIYKGLKENSLDMEHVKIRELVKRIDMLEEELKLIEEEVRKIKVASGPEDISRHSKNQ
jgi:hypothetical protein